MDAHKKMLDPLHNFFFTNKKLEIKRDPPIKFFFLFMAMVILSALVERFSVSRKRDFLLLHVQITNVRVLG